MWLKEFEFSYACNFFVCYLGLYNAILSVSLDSMDIFSIEQRIVLVKM